MNNFSKTLNELFKNKSITQVAKEIGIAKSTLSEWASSKKGPNLSSMHHVRNLADYLGISFEELIFGKESKNVETLTTVDFKDNGMNYTIKIMKRKDSK